MARTVGEIRETNGKISTRSVNGIDKVSVIVNEGNPGELIINKLIPLNKPDLLIIGSKSTSKLKAFGSQAAYMARYAPISVMIIR